jgi:dTDP-glucose pyrophosphorylase
LLTGLSYFRTAEKNCTQQSKQKNMQPTLLILAAGMASRYGSMKQTQSFGPSGETIMDYSIYDAIRAGFGKVVFIIRKDFSDDFKAIFESKLASRIHVEYVYQDIYAFINGYQVPTERTKPWGTGHAVLCAKDTIKEPFAVINADDFYGRDAFEKAAVFLREQAAANHHAIIGYQLSKTLSDYGTVSRGVCRIDADNHLVNITERTKIYRQNDTIVYEENEQQFTVPEDSSVSMNFWCFHPSIFSRAEHLFDQFVRDNLTNPKSEFFIPIIADDFIRNGAGDISLIPTNAQWFGVTYKEDAPGVKASIDALVAAGEYPTNLWPDKE